MDWEWFLGYYQVLGMTLLEHGQLPGFNPWNQLGSPLWANPQIGPISHITPLVLLFGPLYGLKLGLAVMYFISFETGRALGKELFKTPQAPVIAGLLYALNTGLAANLMLGHICFYSYCLAPLLVLFCLRLSSSLWAGVGAGAVAGLMIQYGVHYYMIYALLLCGMLTLWLALRRRLWAPLLRFGLQFILAMLLVSAVRLLPILEVLSDFPRKLTLPMEINLTMLRFMFLEQAVGPNLTVWRARAGDMIFTLSSCEFYAYPGILVTLFAAASLRWGVRFFHVGALLGFLCLLGAAATWQPSYWLSQVRPFDSMWVVTRWRVIFLACLAFAAAAGLERLLTWSAHRRPFLARTLPVLALALPLELLLILYPSWSQVCPYQGVEFSRKTLGLPETSHPLTLRQVKYGLNRTDSYHGAFRANLALASGYEPLFSYSPIKPQRPYWGHPDYRGEFLVSGKKTTPTLWSPNRILFHGLPPGEDLYLNINPGRGWTLNGEAIFSTYLLFELKRQFLVTVPATGTVDLRYTPPGLLAGLWISLGAGLILLFWFLVERRRSPGLP